MRSTTRWLAILGFGALAACGGGDGPREPLDGTWHYSGSLVGSGNAAGITCAISNLTLTISESGANFSGRYRDGVIACTGPGGSSSASTGSGLVTSGSYAGGAVSFDFDNSGWHHSGGLQGNQLSGTGSAQFDNNGTALPFTENWSATR